VNILFRTLRKSINEIFEFPGDKSIAHRSLIIGSLPKGNYCINNFPFSEDTIATLNCVKKLGVDIKSEDGKLLVRSPGYEEFFKSIGYINAKNSGTTARLMSGLLCGLNIKTTIVGDQSLSKRPMGRVTEPLKLMGAKIESTNGHLPVNIYNCGKLKGIDYEPKVPSAQVKSSMLIAGFLADGITTIREIKKTREHTERIFKYLGADIKKKENSIYICNSKIYSRNFNIPGDISSAAFIIACSLLLKDCRITINNVLLSADRRTYIDLLMKMGANIELQNVRSNQFEEIGDIIACSSCLNGIEIDEKLIPNIIDEIPVMAVIAAFSKGKTTFKNVNELKFKESNRINSIIINLEKCGIRCSYDGENLIIDGNKEFINIDINIESFMDHRIAMAFAVMACRNYGKTIIEDWNSTYISLPSSENYFSKLLDITIL
jgi:3-phosphoshikimate 1-carboxyvinyltransferase